MLNLPQKLYVQYMPDRASRELLMELQSDLQALTERGRVVPENQLHVTVLHFGFVQETFKQLLLLNPQLSKGHYQQSVAEFIKNIRPELPETCELTINTYSHFGPHSGTAVLTFKEDLALAKAYAVTMKYLRTFAENVGIPAIANIPSQPRALQVPTSLTPHISLVKGLHSVLDAEPIVKPYIGQTLCFDLYQL